MNTITGVITILKNNRKDKIVPAFETTLFDSTLSDACVDMAELGIDSLLR